MRLSGSAILKMLHLVVLCAVLLGFSTREAQAQVGAPPAVTVQPTNTTVQLLGTAVFTVYSKRGLTYQWLLNGQPYSGGVAVNLPDVLDLSQTVSTLTVVGVSNSSSFSLKVSNIAGSVTSSPAVVTYSGLLSVVTNVVNFVASGTGKLANGAFKLTLAVPTGSNIVVQASSDFSHWTSLSTNTATSSSMTFTDAAAATVSCRFYRARIQ